MRVHLQQPLFLCPFHNAVAERAFEEFGNNTENIDLHTANIEENYGAGFCNSGSALVASHSCTKEYYSASLPLVMGWAYSINYFSSIAGI
jgi:hypothetical protein